MRIPKRCFQFLIIFLINSASALAQTSTRPGGGVEFNHGGVPHFPVSTLKNLFNEQLKKCDTYSKNLLTFQEIYDYLYVRDFKNAVKDLNKKEDSKQVNCQNNNLEIIDCILTDKIKKEIRTLMNDKDFLKTWQYNLKLSNEELELRFFF